MNDSDTGKEKKIWFRRKKYGWGWYPANWKGWVALATYVVFAVGGKYVLFTPLKEKNVLWWFLGYLIVISVVFVVLARKKGESPRWQWGRPKH
jgi:hypothetical protein